MDLISHLALYLSDCGFIDALAKRQADLICRGLKDDDAQRQCHAIVLLLLASLKKGSPRSDRESLLAPLAPEMVTFFTGTYFQSHNYLPSWADALGDVLLFAESALNDLFAQPDCFHPLTGKEPDDGRSTWPLLVLDNDHLGFSRYWNAVRILEDIHLPQLLQQSKAIPDDTRITTALRAVFTDQSGFRYHFRQLSAAALACRNRFLILSGGPGTGKTSVILQIIRTLVHVFDTISPDRIAICAPTGRAKARLSESLDTNTPALNGNIFSAISRKTVHSLLGQRSDGTFKYNTDNKLPFQVVILDEASMLDIHLFSALLEALADDARLILVGDMHQLPSVDAGAVLGDLTGRFAGCPHSATLSASTAQWLGSVISDIPVEGKQCVSDLQLPSPEWETHAGSLKDHVVFLTRSYRSSEAILALATAVNNGIPEEVITLLGSDKHPPTLSFSDSDISKLITGRINDFFHSAEVKNAFTVINTISDETEHTEQLISAVNILLFRSVFLTFVHESKHGRKYINSLSEAAFREALNDTVDNRLFHGLPVILGANHHSLDLYNGDLGIVFKTNDGLKICFPRGKRCYLTAADRLNSVEPAFALTVHKSQGSEFDNVTMVLPEKPGPNLSRQIVYTGITRAKKSVTIAGSEDVLKQAISSQIRRAGGIKII